jgi:hypothetical protein
VTVSANMDFLNLQYITMRIWFMLILRLQYANYYRSMYVPNIPANVLSPLNYPFIHPRSPSPHLQSLFDYYANFKSV